MSFRIINKVNHKMKFNSMRNSVCLLFFLLMFISLSAQQKRNTEITSNDTLLVEAACGQCQFGINNVKGCDLAVRINDKVYFVVGSKIDDHGDAHAEDGFCNAIRKAKVTGKIKGRKFVASSFVLLPE